MKLLSWGIIINHRVLCYLVVANEVCVHSCDQSFHVIIQLRNVTLISMKETQVTTVAKALHGLRFPLPH